MDKINHETPIELNIEDFKYFIVVKGIMVVGVYKEDDEKVYAVVLKSHAAKRGSVTGVPKALLSEQVEAGVATIISSYEEAMQADISIDIPEDVLNYLDEKEEE